MEFTATKDKDGTVTLWDDLNLPLKKNNTLGYWYGQHLIGRCIRFEDKDNEFTDVQWSDEEPTKVKLIIEK